MSLYVDTANIEDASTAAQTGWIAGITTNPILQANSELPPGDTLRKLAALQVKEIYYQVQSSEITAMAAEAQKVKMILGDKLVIKIPPTKLGFQFAASISPTHKTCITAIFSPAQALVAKETGTNYIAVYVSRATRLMVDGIKLIGSIAEVLKGSQTEILAASLKSTEEALDAYAAGAQHLTLPFSILGDLIDNQLSQQAVDQFNQNGIHI
jgi:transaldolase